MAVSVKSTLNRLLDTLSDERQREVLDFATFLAWQDDRDGWRRFGATQLARAYGPNEPEYTLADVEPGPAE